MKVLQCRRSKLNFEMQEFLNELRIERQKNKELKGSNCIVKKENKSRKVEKSEEVNVFKFS